jgi:hypothetical protein
MAGDFNAFAEKLRVIVITKKDAQAKLASTAAGQAEVRGAMSEQRTGSERLLGLIQDLYSLSFQVRDGSAEMEKGNETLLAGTTELPVAAEGAGFAVGSFKV